MTAKTKNAFKIVMTQQRPFQREHINASEPVLKKTLFIPSRILFASQHVLTKALSCLRGLKMILKMCCPNPSHTNEDTKCNLNKCWSNSLIACEEMLTYVHQTCEIPARSQNETKIVFNKPLQCQQVQNVSPLGLTNQVPCQWGDNKHLNICRPKAWNTSEDTKFISTKYQREQNIYLNIWWPNPFDASEDTKWNQNCVLQASPMPARTKCISTWVDQTGAVPVKTQ